MAIDLTKLSSQGRAYSPLRPWTEEELAALLMLETERKLSRLTAADYVRNGILTLEAFDKAAKKDFKPKTLEDAQAEVEESLKDNEFAGQAETATEPELTREQLEARAKELGISFKANVSDKTLAKKIAEAESGK